MPAVIMDFCIAATAATAEAPEIPVIVLPIHYQPAAGGKATRS